MKTIFTFLTMIFMVLILPISSSAQCIATATNVTCTGAGDLSFDLTITNAGLFVSPSSTGGINFSDGGSLVFNTLVSGGNQLMDDFIAETTISANCADVIGKSLQITSGVLPAACSGVGIAFGPITPVPTPVPTMGQWGLIILSLLMLITGVVAMKETKNKAKEVL